MIKSRIDTLDGLFPVDEFIGGRTETIKRAFGQLSTGAAHLSLPRAALYSVLAVSGVESAYGAATNPPAWVGSNNWGAIQCSHGPPCGDDCFETVDTHADGKKYTWCFAKYATPEQGAAALASLLKKRVGVEKLSSANGETVAAAMKEARYFEAPLERYASALSTHLKSIVEVLGPSGAATSESGMGIIGALVLGGGAYMLLRRARR